MGTLWSQLRSRLTVVGTVLLLLSWDAVAHAVEHGAEHQASLGDLLYPLINFLAFAFIVRRYGWPAVKQYLGERQRQALEEQRKSQAALEAAQARLAAAQSRAGRLEEEKELVRREVISAAERLRDRVLRAAEDGARRISRDTELVLAQERRRAMHLLRLELAEATVEEAERLIHAKISERDQQRFRHLLLEEVGHQ